MPDERLPEKFRNLIVMRFMARLSAVQIAEPLGNRSGTVCVCLHRSLWLASTPFPIEGGSLR